MIRQTLRAIAILSASAFLLSACGNQVSLANYNKLKTGQSYDEVKKIVGEPTRCDEALGIRACTWGDEKRGFSVNFVADKALLLSAHNLD